MSETSMEDQHPTIHVDPSGDLNLIAECPNPEEDEPVTKTFVVSAKVMCLASPVWKAMFDPSGPWAKRSSGTEGVKMLEDDPDALLILLDAAHLNFDHVPKAVNFDQLLHLAILCDKYDTFRLVGPWISEWIGGQELLRPVYNPGNEAWLFISWSFGREGIYNNLSKHLVSTLSIDDSGQCLSPAAKVLGENMPPGAIENIRTARQTTVEALLHLCGKLVDTYVHQPRVCKGYEDSSATFTSIPDYAKECDALVLGSLMRGLGNSGLWPIPEDSDDVKISVSTLKEKLLRIECHTKKVIGIKSPSGGSSLFDRSLTTDTSPIPSSSIFSNAQTTNTTANPGPPLWYQAPARDTSQNPPTSVFSQPRPADTPPNPPRPLFNIFPSTVQQVEASQNANNFAKPKTGSTGVDHLATHEQCKFTTNFRKDVQRILNEMQSGVSDEHREHLANRKSHRSSGTLRA